MQAKPICKIPTKAPYNWSKSQHKKSDVCELVNPLGEISSILLGHKSSSCYTFVAFKDTPYDSYKHLNTLKASVHVHKVETV